MVWSRETLQEDPRVARDRSDDPHGGYRRRLLYQMGLCQWMLATPACHYHDG